MNHNIKTEYHIDKLSDLGYSSGDSDYRIKYKKDKKNKKIFNRNIKRSVNKRSSDNSTTTSSVSSSASSASSDEPLFTIYGSDYSQYNDFSNSWHQNMIKFNSQYPLIMRYLLDIDADCSDSNKSNNCLGNKVKSNNLIKPSNPQIFKKISNNHIPNSHLNDDLYLRDIIKIYNEMQIQYTDLFNNIRDILIKAGYVEYTDQSYIVKPIIIEYNHIPKPSDEFFSFMRKLKADINQIVQTIENLYEYVGIKNSDVVQIREFYNNVRLKQVHLVPMDKTKYPETELNKKLADIFNLLGGRRSTKSSTKSSSKKISNHMSGGALNDTDQMIMQLRERLETYKRLINPLDITSIQRLNDSKRLMLTTGEERKYEEKKNIKTDGIISRIPENIEVSDVSLDKFVTYDKDYLVDTILNNTGSNSFVFNPDIKTFDLTEIINTLKPMYNNFSQQIKEDEIKPIIKDMEKFINYKFDDLKEDSFSFITEEEFEFKINKEKNANYESPTKKLKEEIDSQNIINNNLFLINNLPELINLIVIMDTMLIEQGKSINDYKNNSLDNIYNDIKRITIPDVSDTDIKKIEDGYKNINDIVHKFYPSPPGQSPYSHGSAEMSTYGANSRKDVFTDPFKNHTTGEDDTYFFFEYSNPSNKTSKRVPTKDFLITFGNLYNYMNKNIILLYKPDTRIEPLDTAYKDNNNNKVTRLSKVDRNLKNLKKYINILKETDQRLRSIKSDKYGTELGSGIFPGTKDKSKKKMDFINYQKFFKEYIETYEKLIDGLSNTEKINEIDRILDNIYSVSTTVSSQLKDLGISGNVIRPYLGNIRIDDNIINNIIITRDIETFDDRIQKLKQNISKQYEDNKKIYDDLVARLNIELSKSDNIIFDPVNKELEIINADREQLKLEVTGLVKLLEVVDNYNTKIKVFSESLSDSYTQIRKNAKSKYYIDIDPEIVESRTRVKSGFEYEDVESDIISHNKSGGSITDKFNEKIDKNELNSTQLINNIFDKIMYIENIKKGVGDTEKILKYGFELVSDIQGIILYTLNVLQKITTMCGSDSLTCKIKMVKYIEYDNLVKFKKTLGIVINNKSLMTDCQNKAIKGPIIRISNFLQRIIDIVEPKEIKPTYVMIDISKKSFIPLIITQSLSFYTFDGRSMIKCL
jgi:hypothetical protein